LNLNGNHAMTVWAIVPVKPLRRGKSRLAGVLSQSERTLLNRAFLIHVLETLKQVPQVEHILVVSRDSQALAVAREHGARTLLERGHPHLNDALLRATMVVRQYAAPAVLILPADLPLVAPEDVEALLEAASDPPVVAVAPDHHREGTNALVISPPGQIAYAYGPGSFARHCALASENGTRLEVVERRGLAFDVDYPDDLAWAWEADLPQVKEVLMRYRPVEETS